MLKCSLELCGLSFRSMHSPRESFKFLCTLFDDEMSERIERYVWLGDYTHLYRQLIQSQSQKSIIDG